MFTLGVVVFLTIFISLNCSLYEAILYSSRIGALEAVKRSGRHTALADRMLGMKRHIAAPIAAILILNTLANTAGATLAGMYANRELGPYGPWAVPVFSLVFTAAILIFSEIIPKTVGAIYWRSLWPLTVWPLIFMRMALAPFIFLTEKLTRLLTGTGTQKVVTEDDILGIARLGAAEGEISEMESLLIRNALRLEEVSVRAVLTPRTVLFCLAEETSIAAALPEATARGFRRIPVYQGERENITGYVMIHDLASARAQEDLEKPVAHFRQPIATVAEQANCLQVLARFLKERRQLALVRDEYGGLAGLVTLEDLVETLLGAEIVDEHDAVVDLQAHARARPQNRTD